MRSDREVRVLAFPFLLPFNASTHVRLQPTAATRHASSTDSDSEYGSRSHKRKKKPRQSTEEIRVSSRGGKIPNYVDDVQDFEKFDEEEAVDPNYYVDPNIQYQEEDEIEAVLTHSRDEGHENDPEDLWFENIVRACVPPSPHRF